MNFTFGFVLGSMFGQKKTFFNEPLEPSEEVVSRQDKIISYLRAHPYSTCGEVAKGVQEESREVSPCLIALCRKGKASRVEDEDTGMYKYFCY